MKTYRPCVVAVIAREDGYLLVGERSDQPGAWQLPQGGIDDGESSEEALFRELREEIGTRDVTIITKLSKPIYYDFPAEMNTRLAKQFRGQEQWWFHLKLQEKAKPDLSLSDGEFQSLAWHTPKEVLQGIISWKKVAYEQGLRQLGILGEHI